MAALQVKSKSGTYRFLNRCCNEPATTGETYNLLCLLGGKHQVPDDKYTEFLKHYAQDVGHYVFDFVERRAAVFPLILDLDFEDGNRDERLEWLYYVLSTLRDRIVQPMLRERGSTICLGQTDDDATDEQMATQAVFNDCKIAHRHHERFHVVFPKLLVSTAHAVAMIKCLKINLTETDVNWDKVIDQTVVAGNGLRMLGSFKGLKHGNSSPDMRSGFYVPCRVDWNTRTVHDETISLLTLEEHGVHLTPERLMGLRNSDALCFFNLEIPADQRAAKGPAEGGACILFEALETAVMGLPESCYGSHTYGTWSRIIWAAHNTALASGYEPQGLELVHRFSKQAAQVYDDREVDRLWDRARTHGGLCSFGTIMYHLKEANFEAFERTRNLLRAAAAAQPREEQNAPWGSAAMQAQLSSLLPELSEPFTFKIEPAVIRFTAGEVPGCIQKKDSAVLVKGEFKGYLASHVNIPGSLEVLHNDIRETMDWQLHLERTDRASLETSDPSQTSIVWSNPFTPEAYLTVHVAGVRRGSVVQRRATLQYLERRAESAVMEHLQARYGLTQAHFTNCVFNVNVGRGDGRSTDDALVRMWMEHNPELAAQFKFSPDAKSASCNGLYRCDPDTHLWVQVHNTCVESVLREGFASIQGLGPDDRRFIGTRRGIQDLRYELGGRSLDSRFERRLDANLDLFALRNGVLDMAAKAFRPIRPEDYLRCAADWDYSSEDSVLHRADVEAFLEQILPVAEERNVTLSYLAGLLSGRRCLKKVLVLTDRRAGNNGKSTLISLLKCLFSEYAQCNSKFVGRGSFDRDRDSHDAGMEPFIGCRLLIAEELKANMRLDVAMLKMLSGGAGVTVQGRRCGSSEVFRFTWTAGMVLVFNEGDCPQFDVGDEAWIGRMIVAPMRSKFVPGQLPDEREPHTFPADTGLEERFPLWRSALLDVLLEHYRTEDFAALPKEMQEWKTSIVDDGNAIAQWLSDSLHVTGDRANYLKLEAIFTRYNNELIDVGGQMGSKEFKRCLRAWASHNGAQWRETDKVDGNGEERKSIRNILRKVRFQQA